MIRAGDRIYLRQENYGVAKAGIIIKFTNGTSTQSSTYDQSGYLLSCDQYTASWHLRYADLSAHAGKTIQDVQIVNDACSAAGAFWGTFTDLALVSTDGAVRPIYNRQKAMTLSVSCDTGVTDCWQIVGHPTNVGWAHFSTTTYYHGDHLGSSRFFRAGTATPCGKPPTSPTARSGTLPAVAAPSPPITTNSPARNATPNPASTTSAPDITLPDWAVSNRRTREKLYLSEVQSSS